MKRLLFAQMGRGKIQCAFTVQLQCNFRSMAPFTPGFTVSLGQFGQSSVAFRRSATPAKRKIGPDCVPQEVGGLAGRLRAAGPAHGRKWARPGRQGGGRPGGARLRQCARHSALVTADGCASCQAHVC